MTVKCTTLDEYQTLMVFVNMCKSHSYCSECELEKICECCSSNIGCINISLEEVEEVEPND